MKSLLVAAALAVATCGGTVPTSGGLDETAEVISVTDGDTFRARVAGVERRVRLIGVDTPEVPWYGGEDECFGEEAGLYARERLTGRRVMLAFDRERLDRYERLLAYVYLGAELFNVTLVQEGYGTALEISPNTRFALRFRAAEAEARREARGLWSACPPP